MMPINKRLKRELKKNFAKYFFIGLVLFMGITIISAFFTATDGIMSTIESQQSDCNIEDANVTLVSQLSDDNISRLHEIGINDLEDTSYCDVTALDDSDYTMRVFRVRDSVDKLSLIEGELPANDKQIVLESKTAREVLRVLHTLRHNLGEDFGKIFRAITCDNGCEFSAAKEMEQLTPIYYCHPYSCWERGTNENQNKLIRRFCKKGKSMAGITPDHAEYITLWMNNYPRRLLGWQRPADLMAAECAALDVKMPV